MKKETFYNYYANQDWVRKAQEANRERNVRGYGVKFMDRYTDEYMNYMKCHFPSTYQEHIDGSLVYPEKFLEFLKQYPEDYARYSNWVHDQYQKYGGICEEALHSALCWAGYDFQIGPFGFLSLLCDKIYAEDGVRLYYEVTDDILIFPDPDQHCWELNDKEKSLGKVELEKLFRKWIGRLTDNTETVRFGELTIENEY